MNSIILSTLVLLTSMTCNKLEKSDCNDYKEGSYKIYMSGDSQSYYTINRTHSSQIETNENGDKVFYTIKWISDCSYIQKFDRRKMELNDEMKMINNDGGMVVELLDVKIENRISFKSYVKKFKEMSLTTGEFEKIKN